MKEIIEVPCDCMKLDVPAEFLVVRPVPMLHGDRVEDYIQFGLSCKANLQKSNEDMKSLMLWLESIEN